MGRSMVDGVSLCRKAFKVEVGWTWKLSPVEGFIEFKTSWFFRRKESISNGVKTVEEGYVVDGDQ